jgi:hypothetical protein
VKNEVMRGRIAVTPKQQLLKEIDDTPISLIPDVLNYIRFLKAQRLAKQSQADIMQFAGMLADTPNLADGIIEDAELNRQLDLQRHLEV